MSDPATPPQEAPQNPLPGRAAGPSPRIDRSMAVSPESAEPHEVIRRLNERLSFYESFDSLIQDTISRSGKLLREAAARRDEANQTIADSIRQRETFREEQRTVLSGLLEDIMSIQQATERLAHRVADTLEQIEFDIEPPGLGAGSAAERQLPDRSAAELVHDEVRSGAFARTTPTVGLVHGNDAGSLSVSSAEPDSAVPNDPEQSADEDDDVLADLPAHPNPETESLSGDEDEEPRDLPAPGARTLDEDETHEHIGAAYHRAPAEASAATWENDPSFAHIETPPMDESVPPGASGDAETVADPAASSRVIVTTVDTYSEAEPEGETEVEPERETDQSAGTAVPETTRETAASPPASDNAAPATPETATTTAPATGRAMSGAAAPPARESPPVGDSVDTHLSGTTVVLGQVPKASVALAIQRNILSSEQVLRAEVREYYDHRLTLLVVAARSITADDIRAWDSANSWVVVSESPERIEMTMSGSA